MSGMFCAATRKVFSIGRLLRKHSASGRPAFFTLLKLYRKDPEKFTLAYQRSTPAKLSREAEEEIAKALWLDKSLVEDRELPITTYNYSAIRNRLLKQGIRVSITTMISRAKAFGWHQSRRQSKGSQKRQGRRSAENA